ncbi:alpha-L-fucosidase C-terminal domain-containing protein [Bacteroidota bacterium]
MAAIYCTGSEIVMLGVDEPLKWKEGKDGIEIEIPFSVIQSPPCKYAYAFRIQTSK